MKRITKEMKKKVIEKLLDGLTYSEIAIKLDLTINQVKKIEKEYLNNLK